MKKYVIGIDEVGRGPLAGPVGVGAVLVQADFSWNLLPGINDSKMLSETKRTSLTEQAGKLRKDGKLDYAVVMISSTTIDELGIVKSIERAISRSLTLLKLRYQARIGPTSASNFELTSVLLDGGLKAPKRFLDQKTFIKGDQKEPVISLASVVAKVARDKHMVRAGAEPQHAPYAFQTHKGYGTKAHIAAIQKYGLSSIHRTTYCKNVKL